MSGFSKHDLATINRILRDPDDKVIATLEQMREYVRHKAAEDRQKQKEGRVQAGKVTAAGRRFLDTLALIDPIGGAKPTDTGGNRQTPRPRSPLRPQTGEPTGAMRLVWQRGGDHQEVLVADRAIRRVLELLRPSAGASGRPTKVPAYTSVIRDLAARYRRRTRKRPTSSPTGDFAELVRVVTRLDNPKDEIAAALSRKPPRKS
jgi:hypothetical protein